MSPSDFPEFYDPDLFKKSKYWVAISTLTGEMLGGIGLKPHCKDPSRKDIEWLNGFTVKPEARSMGIGRVLFETALNNLENDTKLLRLLTFDRLKVPVQMYIKYGFYLLEQMTENEYWTLLIMEKLISQ